MQQPNISSQEEEAKGEETVVGAKGEETVVGAKVTEKKNRLYLLPSILILVTVTLDQFSKFWIELKLEDYANDSGVIRLLNGFIWIVKVYNKGIAFSIAADSNSIFRSLVVFIIPIILIIFLLKIIFYSDLTRRSRWCIALIAGGGLGNLIDRVFRAEGVLDFISVNTYNILNITRWPIFNFADIFVIIGMILWSIDTIYIRRKEIKRLRVEQELEEEEAPSSTASSSIEESSASSSTAESLAKSTKDKS